jgi:hypothetical protein
MAVALARPVDGAKADRTRLALLRLRRPRNLALSSSGGKSWSRLFGLFLGYKSITPLIHALACPATYCAGIKICMTKGYIGLPLFK